MMVKVILALILLISVSSNSLPVFAAKQEQEKAKLTNINEVDDYFDRTIEDKAAVIDAMTKIKADGQSAIINRSAVAEIAEIGKAEEQASQVISIPAGSLEAEGRQAQAGEDYKFYHEGGFEPNLSEPKYQAHAKDVELIAAASNNLLSDITARLKEYGVDCKEHKGNVQQEQEFKIKLVKKEQQSPEYKQVFCEEPKRKYSCSKVLKVKCQDKIDNVFNKESSFSTNLPISITDDGVIEFGYLHNWLSGGEGTEFNYYISFNIEDQRAVQEFELTNVNWDDHILITINDRQIFMAPRPGDRLELINQLDFGPNGKLFKLVKIDGSGAKYSAENNTMYKTATKINLKTYLRSGSNQIKAKLIVAGSGGIWLKVKARMGACSKWKEEYDEKCRLLN